MTLPIWGKEIDVVGHVTIVLATITINSAKLTDQRGSYAFTCSPFSTMSIYIHIFV